MNATHREWILSDFRKAKGILFGIAIGATGATAHSALNEDFAALQQPSHALEHCLSCPGEDFECE